MRILSLNAPKKEWLKADSKSFGCIIYAGSSPASGIIVIEKKPDCSDVVWLLYERLIQGSGEMQFRVSEANLPVLIPGKDS
jgi:hypothetical protein